jgi:hypothetical protein
MRDKDEVSMKKISSYLGKFIIGLLIICTLWLVLDYNDILNHKVINHTVEAGVYIDGIRTEDISVNIEGKYYPNLFKPDSFWGRFEVPYLSETTEDHIIANITWYDRKNGSYQYQLISFFNNRGDIQRIKSTHTIMINRSMDEFVWRLETGEVIATSDKVFLESLIKP